MEFYQPVNTWIINIMTFTDAGFITACIIGIVTAFIAIAM